MTRTRFEGVYTAIITPFTADDKIDFDAFEKLIKHQIDGKVDGIVVNGTTGESPNITDEEVKELISSAITFSDGKLQILVGTGSNSTTKTIKASQQAEKLGADGLLVVNPYYNKPTQEGLYQHFKAVADAVHTPIMLYNIKGRTAVNLETPTLLRLAEHENIISVKEASGDIEQMMDVIQQTSDDFTVLSGDDALTFPLMSLGGDGVVSVYSNVFPTELKQMVDALLNGKIEKARNMHYQCLPVMRGMLSMASNPIPVKSALALKGFCQDHLRLPLVNLSERQKQQLETLLG